MNSQSAILALEDGRFFRGLAFGHLGERVGEVVFNTSLSGYQEIFTDPSYAGQIVVLTYPEIGNYGINPLDAESKRPYIEGLAVREYSPIASSWRSEETVDCYLKRHKVPALSEIDTRALVRHLRDRGSMRGVLSSVDFDEKSLVEKARQAPSMVGLDLARVVSCKRRYTWTRASENIFENGGKGSSMPPNGSPEEPGRFRVVAYDFGIKHNILRQLVDAGCDVTVVPAAYSADDVLALNPDGVFLSNGPGDPEPVTYAIENVRKLLTRKTSRGRAVPIFGICLGHQIMGLAFGGKTFKLKFGHHGGNQPVKNLLTGQVEITAQNHGFAVDPDSLNANEIEVTHVNLNDHTCEGLRHRSYPAFSVQYHPEASPGPHDSRYLFQHFLELMKES